MEHSIRKRLNNLLRLNQTFLRHNSSAPISFNDTSQIIDEKGIGAGYHEKNLVSKEMRFGTLICPRSSIEINSEVFPDFVCANKQFKIPRL